MNAEEILIRLAEERKRVKFSAGSNGREILFVGDVNGIFEFNNAICEAIKLGEELTPKGRWVDFDPAKFTCDQFPIRARVKGQGDGVYVEKTVIGFAHDDGITSFVTSHGHDYDLCQTWEAEQ